MDAATAWTDFDAIAAIDGFDGIEHDEEDIHAAFQHLIDSGLAWRLQGRFGREAHLLINAGICTA